MFALIDIAIQILPLTKVLMLVISEEASIVTTKLASNDVVYCALKFCYL